jgi:hypothetical protein
MTRVALLALAVFAVADENHPKKDKPKFTIGKETTFVTEPLDKDGYVDYSTALNKALSKGITPKTNANVLVWHALVPHLSSSIA